VASTTYEISGRIKKIFDQQTFASGFTKREFVVTTEEDYPQDVKIECIKDRCALLDNVKEGDRVNVNFNIRGNEYNGRFFVNLQAWRMQPQDGQTAGAADAPSASSDIDLPADDFGDLVEDNDVAPF
jgi:single-strand DNA-binding protein